MRNTTTKTPLATIAIGAALLVGCVGPSVRQYGAMRAVMREGDSQPRVRLGEVAGDSSTYAVGALAGLNGEITISGGEVWVTRFDGNATDTTGPACVASDEATLLSVGQIMNPRRVTLEAPLSGERLEAAIGAAALRMAGQPFMFRIDGTATSLNGHVIAGACAHADPGAVVFRLDETTPIAVTIIGLYAPGQPGVLTHHGTDVHMHALLTRNGKRMTVHVDELALAPGAVLTIPGGGQ